MELKTARGIADNCADPHCPTYALTILGEALGVLFSEGAREDPRINKYTANITRRLVAVSRGILERMYGKNWHTFEVKNESPFLDDTERSRRGEECLFSLPPFDGNYESPEEKDEGK